MRPSPGRRFPVVFLLAAAAAMLLYRARPSTRATTGSPASTDRSTPQPHIPTDQGRPYDEAPPSPVTDADNLEPPADSAEQTGWLFEHAPDPAQTAEPPPASAEVFIPSDRPTLTRYSESSELLEAVRSDRDARDTAGSAPQTAKRPASGGLPPPRPIPSGTLSPPSSLATGRLPPVSRIPDGPLPPASTIPSSRLSSPI